MHKSKLNHYYSLLFNGDYDLNSFSNLINDHVLQMDSGLEGEFEDGDRYILPENHQHCDLPFMNTPKTFGKY